jgi:hypothetical protein
MDFELHVTGKKLGWGFCLKAIWSLVTVSILQIGLGTCAAGESPCIQAGVTMEGFMFALSFPTSYVLLALSPFAGWENIHSMTDYAWLWLGAFVAGYVQWFFLVPKLFEAKGITSLGLNSKASLQRAVSRRRKRRFRRHTSHEIKSFDPDGSTPVERVFRTGDRNRSVGKS